MTADCENEVVKIEQLGGHACAVDGVELLKGKKTKAKAGSELQVMTGFYTHVIEFVDKDNNKTTGKRKHTNDEDEHEDESNQKRRKENDEDDSEDEQYKKEMEKKLRFVKVLANI